jgi:hypothetical protein
MPRRAYVRSTVIADRADHVRHQLVVGRLVGQVANIEDRIVVAARIEAIHKDVGVAGCALADSGSGLSCSSRFGIVHGVYHDRADQGRGEAARGWAGAYANVPFREEPTCL